MRLVERAARVCKEGSLVKHRYTYAEVKATSGPPEIEVHAYNTGEDCG